MQATTYNVQGKAAGSVDLPEQVFGQPWNATLLHEVVLALQANLRAGTAHTKTRGEVRGGGKKPWRQKGTGRARHGSRRSPIWVGGGVVFGPRTEKDYHKKLNRAVKAKALGVALSQKLRDDEVIFLDTFALTEPKAKAAKAALHALADGLGKEKLATKRANAALIVLPGRDDAVEKSFSNFGNVLVDQAKDINPLELLSYKYVIIVDPVPALALLSARVATRRRRGTLKTAPRAAEAPKKRTAAPKKAVSKKPKAPARKRTT